MQGFTTSNQKLYPSFVMIKTRTAVISQGYLEIQEIFFFETVKSLGLDYYEVFNNILIK